MKSVTSPRVTQQGCVVEGPAIGGTSPGNYPAIELTRNRQMVARNWERVSVEWDDTELDLKTATDD